MWENRIGCSSIFKKLPSYPANYPIQATEIPSFYLFCLGAVGESTKKTTPVGVNTLYRVFFVKILAFNWSEGKRKNPRIYGGNRLRKDQKPPKKVSPAKLNDVTKRHNKRN